MYKTIILISLFFSCSNELRENKDFSSDKDWEVIVSNDTVAEFEYSISSTDACSYLIQKGEDCCETGWIFCDYVIKANVIFYVDGKVKVSSITINSSIPASDYWSNWHKEKDKIKFDSKLFLNFPLKKHFKWE
jgi:hypothetical protein